MLAAVHHAIDAISRVAACDTDAVRDAASTRRLYLPTRLMPQHYDIPWPYAPLPTPMAGDLIGSYHTAASASLRAAITLDGLAVTTGAPSSLLATARAQAGSPAIVPQPGGDDSVQRQAHISQLTRAPRLQAGHTESILLSLRITETALLLRAAAIDDAAADLFANASTSSHHRDSLDQPTRAACRAPRTAARDLPRAAADLGLPVGIEAPVADAPPARRPQTALQNSRN